MKKHLKVGYSIIACFRIAAPKLPIDLSKHNVDIGNVYDVLTSLLREIDSELLKM